LHLGAVAEGLEAEDLYFLKLEQGAGPLLPLGIRREFAIGLDRSTRH
jgi:hypothetical protein